MEPAGRGRSQRLGGRAALEDLQLSLTTRDNQFLLETPQELTVG